jgi:hypothetical protein
MWLIKRTTGDSMSAANFTLPNVYRSIVDATGLKQRRRPRARLVRDRSGSVCGGASVRLFEA